MYLFMSPGPEVTKIFMLNSAEHEVLNAFRYKSIKKFSIFQAQISIELLAYEHL